MDEFLRQFLMLLAAPADDPAPAGGGGVESNDETPQAPTDEPQPNEEQLGEGGKKALQAEREARKQADKRVAELEAQLAQTGTANEDALKEAQTLAQQAQEQLTQAQTEAARYKVAARFGVSTEPGEEDAPSDAEMFLTGSTEEELISQAQRLQAIRQASQDDALVDLTQGGGGRPKPVEPDPGAPRLAAAFDAQINK